MARPTQPTPERQASLIAAPGLPTNNSQVKPDRARKRKSSRARQWQEQVWGYYDTVGELRYAAGWYSNALSRAEIYVGQRGADGSVTRLEETHKAAQALAEILGDRSTQIKKQLGQHWFLVGEMFLISRIEEGDEDPRWGVYSTREVNYQNGKWRLSLTDETVGQEVEDDAVIRVFNPHPAKHNEPDSPVKAVLGDLEEIALLSAHVKAQVRSRLTSSGLVVLPQSIEFTPPPGLNPAEAMNYTPATFSQALIDVASLAISAPGSAEAQVPIVVTAPDDAVDKIQHLNFWSDLDEKASEMRRDAIARTALGLDLPPEILTGTGEVNHWGSWQIEESTIKAHIEPALDTIVSFLTEDVIRLVESDPTIAVYHDTSKLRLRPNRSKEALELWDRGALSVRALMRETGFDGSDRADDEDVKLFVLLKMASGSATPEMVALAANLLGVEGVEAAGDDTNESRPTPSLEGHPTRDLPDGLAASCEVVVYRALERAGNRLKNNNRGMAVQGIAAMDLYRHVQPSRDQHDSLLADAWGMLDRVVPAEHLQAVEGALDDYARLLLRTQQEPTRKDVASCLARAIN